MTLVRCLAQLKMKQIFTNLKAEAAFFEGHHFLPMKTGETRFSKQSMPLRLGRLYIIHVNGVIHSIWDKRQEADRWIYSYMFGDGV